MSRELDALYERIAVLEAALGFRDVRWPQLTPQQNRIAAMLSRGPLSSTLLADAVGISKDCLKKNISLMRKKNVRIVHASDAYRMEQP